MIYESLASVLPNWIGKNIPPLETKGGKLKDPADPLRTVGI